MEEKNNELLCILLNVKDLKVKNQKAKNNILRHFILQSKADLMDLQEININQNKVEYLNRWQERSISWWEEGHSISITFNYNDIGSTKKSAFQ